MVTSKSITLSHEELGRELTMILKSLFQFNEEDVESFTVNLEEGDDFFTFKQSVQYVFKRKDAVELSSSR